MTHEEPEPGPGEGTEGGDIFVSCFSCIFEVSIKILGGNGPAWNEQLAILCFAPPPPPPLPGGCCRESKGSPPPFLGWGNQKNMFWKVFEWVAVGCWAY